jgi:hypothetical protein
VLFSRDPHLAAIGFVWSPLPALVLIPLVLLKGFWPALVQQGFAGNIMSAVFMAGAVYQVNGFLRDIKLKTFAWLALTCAFAVHPTILLFGGNGMSEAAFLFFVLLSVRHLARWLQSPGPVPLINAGFGLAGAYLSRYEALPAGMAAILLVALVTLSRTQGERRRRLAAGLCDSLILGAPFLLALVFWAGSSWAITGHPFEQFSSVYRNSAQIQANGVIPNGLSIEAATLAIEGSLSLEPFLPVAVILGAVRAFRSRDLRVLAVMGIMGPIFGFMSWAYATGTVPTFLRYLIVAVPLTILMFALALAPRSSVGSLNRSLTLRALPVSGLVAALAMTSLAAPVSASGMADPVINGYDATPVEALLNGGNATGQQRQSLRRFETDRAVARYLDELGLRPGSVLVDDFLGFVVVHSSRHPKQFVITSDRDFRQILADPASVGVRYLLVPKPSGLGQLDALNIAYPGMYESGAGIASLRHTFPRTDDASQNWRLYQLDAVPDQLGN